MENKKEEAVHIDSRLILPVCRSLLLVCSIFCGTALATVGPPVNVTVASVDELRVGERMTIYVVLEPLADISKAELQVSLPVEGWQYIGPREWTGNLKKGARLWFEFSVVPIRTNPELPRARVIVPGKGMAEAVLDTSRLGGKTPERVKQSESQESIIKGTPQLRPKWEEQLPLPQPERPRIPTTQPKR